MIIRQAILHIMDFNSDVCVFSQKELDLTDFGTEEFIQKHLTKVMDDGAKKEGEFLEYSAFKQILDRYLKEEIDFTSFSTSAATLLHDQVSQADELESMDVLFCRFSDESENYVAMLLLPNKTAYTHLVERDGDDVANKIIRYFTMLPNTSQKVSSYAVVNLRNGKVGLCDKKRSINGDDVQVLPDRVLQCTFGQSDREAVKAIRKIVHEVAEEYGANSAIAVSRAKSCIIENAEQDVPFTPSDICEGVFYDNEVMKNSFKEKAVEVDLPPRISIDNQKVVKSIRSHKIKTDTGIEITIPTEYLENSQFVEFINNPDGSLSIQLNNIGKIVNR